MKTLLLAAAMLSNMAASQPAVGDKAQDFELQSLDGKATRRSEETAKGPVVLLASRGFPGYQCPMCNRQVNEFIKSAQAFAEMGVRVVMVYPGPPDRLHEHAKEFTADKVLPSNFVFPVGSRLSSPICTVCGGMRCRRQLTLPPFSSTRTAASSLPKSATRTADAARLRRCSDS